MIQRLKTAIPLILIVTLAFILPQPYCAFFFAVMAFGIIAFACQEAFAMLKLPHGKAFQTVATIFAAALILLPAFFKDGPLSQMADMVSICLFILTAAMIVFKYGPTENMVHAFMVSLGVFLYACWSLSFMSKLYFLNGKDGMQLLAYIIIVTKMADVGAYFVGSLSAKLPGGNHKLAPTLSPKKSWEGLLGGSIFATAAAVGFMYIPGFTDYNGLQFIKLPEAVVIGILAAVIGLIGDLIESAIKRAADMKDSGHIPGIGGILDVLDSLIPIAPLFYAFIIFKIS